MINEPESGAGGNEEDVFGEPGVIHVSPQDKEAIERVREPGTDVMIFKIFSLKNLAKNWRF
jgi:hypothetical protein